MRHTQLMNPRELEANLDQKLSEVLGAVKKPEQRAAVKAADQSSADQAMGIGLKLSKRAMETSSLDELFFFLTNDTRTLVEFDRCFLLLYLGDQSRFVAVNNQPTVEDKSVFKAEWNKLAQGIAGHDKVVFLSKKHLDETVDSIEGPQGAKDAFRAYVTFGGCNYFLCLPLIYRSQVVAHLVFEFMDAAKPKKAVLEILVEIGPALATALFEEWCRKTKPTLWGALTSETDQAKTIVSTASRKLATTLLCAVALVSVFFFFPTTFTVGGEVEIVPDRSRMAFSNLDAMIDKVMVREGDSVTKGQTLAALDPTDIDYRIAKAKREAEILGQEISIQAAEAFKDQASWAKKKVAELKRQSMLEEEAFLKWKRGFLTITSPVNGIIMTKNVESLKGKSLKTGEPFCEIAVPSEFCAEIRVPEERIGYVSVGQTAVVYLNTDPSRGYRLEVSEIPPAAKMMPRVGNVFGVRAPFPQPPSYLKLGMKGIGKIHTKSTNLWYIVSQRVLTRWNEFALSW